MLISAYEHYSIPYSYNGQEAKDLMEMGFEHILHVNPENRKIEKDECKDEGTIIGETASE